MRALVAAETAARDLRAEALKLLHLADSLRARLTELEIEIDRIANPRPCVRCGGEGGPLCDPCEEGIIR